MSTNHTGLPCPKCNFKIKFTMQSLLISEVVTCPSCKLELQMNVPDQMKSHLQEIVLAEQMIKKAQNFKG